MVEHEYEAEQSRHGMTDVEHVRARMGMYVGSTDFFGLVNYLVCAFDLMLDNGATWIEFDLTAKSEGFRVSSDAQIPTRLSDEGLLVPFESLGSTKPRRSPDALILSALSERLRAQTNDGMTETTLTMAAGERESLEQSKSGKLEQGTRLTFIPDERVFSVTEVSPAVAHSYCNRTARFHPGVAFRVKQGTETTEYRSTDGIRDFFRAVSMPYQVLHSPISIRESEGDLKVEAMFVFQSWTENRIWSFANKGRVPNGGTHEAGLLDAVSHLKLTHTLSPVGVLAVLAIESPNVTYEGCIKARVGNPELRQDVCRLVTRGLDAWVQDNPAEVEYLKSIERFQFAQSW